MNLVGVRVRLQVQRILYCQVACVLVQVERVEAGPKNIAIEQGIVRRLC